MITAILHGAPLDSVEMVCLYEICPAKRHLHYVLCMESNRFASTVLGFVTWICRYKTAGLARAACMYITGTHH